MTFEEVLIIGVAAWRLARFAVYETGPGGIMRWLRERAGIAHDDDGDVVSVPDTFPGTLLACVWCASAWTAMILYGVWVAEPTVVKVVAMWGIASAAEAVFGRAAHD